MRFSAFDAGLDRSAEPPSVSTGTIRSGAKVYGTEDISAFSVVTARSQKISAFAIATARSQNISAFPVAKAGVPGSPTGGGKQAGCHW